jgi:uncharacterized protein YecT (DUF1311 family)
MIRLIIFIALLCFGKEGISQSQREMNQEAMNEYKKSESKINLVYQEILKTYKSDVAFLTNLRAAQRLWIQFRDAEMKALFPDRAPAHYGSVQPMCWWNSMTSLTNERIEKLKVWIDGTEEGDVCPGSVKVRE